MPLPTTFIAVQCCECSMMQVKQKKSSNKWSCVVCNQKQSIRKVYAQGFMAKDVRKFVQTFNMSRHFADEQNSSFPQADYHEQNQTLEIEQKFQVPANRKQKRTDWSEYMDPAEEDVQSGGGGIDEYSGDKFEPKIVTEKPKAVFKKPKFKSYGVTSNRAAGEKSFVPVFGNQNAKTKSTPQAAGLSRHCATAARGTSEWRELAAETKGIFSDREEAKELQPTYGTSKWKDSSNQENDNLANKGRWRSQSATAKKLSKWSNYITEDDDLVLGNGRDLITQANQWTDNAFETEFSDQRVEEDVHPDFV